MSYEERLRDPNIQILMKQQIQPYGSHVEVQHLNKRETLESEELCSTCSSANKMLYTTFSHQTCYWREGLKLRAFRLLDHSQQVGCTIQLYRHRNILRDLSLLHF